MVPARAACKGIVDAPFLNLTPATRTGVIHDAALLHDFAAPDGTPLAEDALAAALETLAGGAAAPLALRYRGALVPVAPLRAAEASARFGFVPSPHPDFAEEACT